MSFDSIDKLKSNNLKLAKKMNMILEEKQQITKERDNLKVEAIKLDYTVKLNKRKADEQVKFVIDEIEEDIDSLRFKLDRLRFLLNAGRHSTEYENGLSQLDLSQNFKSTPNKFKYSIPRKQKSPTKEPQIITIIDSPNTQLSEIFEDNKETKLGRDNPLVKMPLSSSKKEFNQPKFNQNSDGSTEKRSSRGNRNVNYQLPSLKRKLRRSE